MRYSTHFKQRLAASAVALTLLFIALHFAFVPWFQPIYVLLVAAVISTALWEFYQISRNKGVEPNAYLGIAATGFYAMAVYASLQSKVGEGWSFFVLGVTLALAFAWQLYQQRSPILNIAVTLLGVMYLTIPLSSIIHITYFFPEGGQDGRIWLLYLLAVAKMADTGGYFFGKLFGKRPLAPIISPKKTWEGALGGVFTSILISFIFALVLANMSRPPIALTVTQSLWMALLISIMAQFGDLAESLIKRDANVKDSNALPGLGGALDVMDSLVFTTPLVYGILYLLYS